MGKGKPFWAPHVDCGDFVIVLNAEKVHLSGTKEETKVYYRHTTTQPGSLKSPEGLRSPRQAPQAARRERGVRHASQDQARPQDPQEAEGLRRRGASAPGPEAAAFDLACGQDVGGVNK